MKLFQWNYHSYNKQFYASNVHNIIKLIEFLGIDKQLWG